MKVNEALKITDSFTKTSKMPGLSYSLPAWECKTGWKLSQVEGTPCFYCYAKKNNYGHEVTVNGPCKVVYSPDKPLSCGAKVWIETESGVTVVNKSPASTKEVA